MNKKKDETGDDDFLATAIRRGVGAARAGIAEYWESDCANLPDPETFERMVFATVERNRFNEEQRLYARAMGVTPIQI